MIAATCGTDRLSPRLTMPPSGPLAVLSQTLRQLGQIVETASDDQYVLQPVGVIDGSLGGHVRHCLDHVATLLDGAQTGRLDYDARRRGTAVETSRAAALEVVGRLESRLTGLDDDDLSRPLCVSVMLTADGLRIDTLSSLGRELGSVLSHTIHHNAIVAAICRTLGIPLPDRFGYAPATIAHLDAAACAPSR
ncbi:MAG: DinB family protein [Phycisphaerae bacterium]|nr:DinB family protein [Phycisphaerae bacterium]NUQ46501.1 DinB family protein [Phycisphaerae bacterium]